MARKQTALSYFSGTLTQGGADAFVQLAVATALTGQTKTAYRLASLEYELGQVRSVVNGAEYQIMMTRKTMAAFPTSPMLEKSVIWYDRIQCATQTAVGFAFYGRTYKTTWSDADAPIIVEDPVYFQLDSALTTVANVVYFRIGYWQDTISEVDKLTLVANSLQ